jgi:hypothetical protein
MDHAALRAVLLSRLLSICLRPQSNKLEASGWSPFLNQLIRQCFDSRRRVNLDVGAIN